MKTILIVYHPNYVQVSEMYNLAQYGPGIQFITIPCFNDAEPSIRVWDLGNIGTGKPVAPEVLEQIRELVER